MRCRLTLTFTLHLLFDDIYLGNSFIEVLFKYNFCSLTLLFTYYPSGSTRGTPGRFPFPGLVLTPEVKCVYAHACVHLGTRFRNTKMQLLRLDWY